VLSPYLFISIDIDIDIDINIDMDYYIIDTFSEVESQVTDSL
jgi:hypothetical protein